MRISDWSSDVCSSDLPNRGSIVIAEEITTPQKHVQVGNVSIGNDLPLVLIAGPCQIESLDHALMMADKIATACAATGIRFIYKSSFDKATRSSHNTARGVGLVKGLEILASVKDRSEEHTTEIQSLMRISYAVFFFTNIK